MPVMTAAEAMTAQLKSLPPYLRPKEPGLFELLLKSAGRLRPDGGLHDARMAAVIYKLQEFGAGYGDTPPPTAINLPADHAMHLDCSNEWYWLSCHLEAVGPNGPTRIAVLLDMLRFRLISKELQKGIGWTDAECQLVWNAVTVAVSDSTGARMYRRNTNAQWTKVGGKARFSKPGEDFFFSCGPDELSGKREVLPLTVKVDDGDNMKLDLTVRSEMKPDKAYFLQGTDGTTPNPRPGLYYSWPQLEVGGRISVGGHTYEATGRGWIDHQLLASQTPTSDP
ncbi:MAG TPA: lipocalin-like domain-containing protein, partial [Caulobacteraceae bacterium]